MIEPLEGGCRTGRIAAIARASSASRDGRLSVIVGRLIHTVVDLLTSEWHVVVVFSTVSFQSQSLFW